jgi:hypothetical protein
MISEQALNRYHPSEPTSLPPNFIEKNVPLPCVFLRPPMPDVKKQCRSKVKMTA